MRLWSKTAGFEEIPERRRRQRNAESDVRLLRAVLGTATVPGG